MFFHVVLLVPFLKDNALFNYFSVTSTPYTVKKKLFFVTSL